MKSRFLHIIAWFFLMIFSSGEVIAHLPLNNSNMAEVSDNADSRGSEQGSEERGLEPESKFLHDGTIVPFNQRGFLSECPVYIAPQIPSISLGILTPPPRHY